MSATTNIGFAGRDGIFTLENAENITGLYLPLADERGLKSAVTPNLGGDSKIDQNTFLLEPVSIENLHSNRGTRNFWCRMADGAVWSVCGASAAQEAEKFGPKQEKSRVTGGFLWQALEREGAQGLYAKTESFVTVRGEQEAMLVTLVNRAAAPLTFTPVAAVPLYGRSADNLRDHRHVTSLLNRAESRKEGVILTPTYSFDERGHTPNQRSYFVFGITEDGKSAEAVCADLDRYTGEGSLIMPEWVAKELPGDSLGGETAGKETIGALRFPETELRPGEKREYDILVGTAEDKAAAEQIAAVWLSAHRIQTSSEETKLWWDQVNPIRTHTGDSDFDNILRWIGIQPTLRRIYGCSFLPLSLIHI
mgnify:CR=1 FL=1